jgi:hypothetical protein
MKNKFVQFKISLERVEDLAKEELLKNLTLEELNSEKKSTVKNCYLNSFLKSKIISFLRQLVQCAKILEQRNLLQNRAQHLTLDVMTSKASKDKLKQEASENVRQMLPVKIKLEMRIASLEKEMSCISLDLCAARSELLLHKKQKENIITTHNKEIERRDCNSVNGTSMLQDEINSL